MSATLLRPKFYLALLGPSVIPALTFAQMPAIIPLSLVGHALFIVGIALIQNDKSPLALSQMVKVLPVAMATAHLVAVLLQPLAVVVAVATAILLVFMTAILLAAVPIAVIALLSSTQATLELLVGLVMATASGPANVLLLIDPASLALVQETLRLVRPTATATAVVPSDLFLVVSIMYRHALELVIPLARASALLPVLGTVLKLPLLPLPHYRQAILRLLGLAAVAVAKAILPLLQAPAPLLPKFLFAVLTAMLIILGFVR